MKTFVRLIMTALMALTLIACGGKAASGTGELATLGDALKVVPYAHDIRKHPKKEVKTLLKA